MRIIEIRDKTKPMTPVVISIGKKLIPMRIATIKVVKTDKGVSHFLFIP